MEWWENDDGYEAVDETNNYGALKLYKKGSGLNTRVGLGYQNDSGNYTNLGQAKATSIGKGAAGAAALGAAAYGAKKFYDSRKKKKAQAAAAAAAQAQQATKQIPVHVKGYGGNAAGTRYAEGEANGYVKAKENWILDPGANEIMESYFSEFADADLYEPATEGYEEDYDEAAYGPEPTPNEWDQPEC